MPFWRVVWELFSVELRLFISDRGKTLPFAMPWILLSDFRGCKLGTFEVRLRNFSLLSYLSRAWEAKLGSLEPLKKLFFLIISGFRVPI